MPAYSLYSNIIGALVHFFFILVFCGIFGWGFTGICYASGLLHVARLVANMLLVSYGGIFKTDEASFFSKASFTKLGP